MSIQIHLTKHSEVTHKQHFPLKCWQVRKEIPAGNFQKEAKPETFFHVVWLLLKTNKIKTHIARITCQLPQGAPLLCTGVKTLLCCVVNHGKFWKLLNLCHFVFGADKWECHKGHPAVSASPSKTTDINQSTTSIVMIYVVLQIKQIHLQWFPREKNTDKEKKQWYPITIMEYQLSECIVNAALRLIFLLFLSSLIFPFKHIS